MTIYLDLQCKIPSIRPQTRNMTLKSLTQPFKSTFQPLPSTPAQPGRNAPSGKATPKEKRPKKLRSKRQPGLKSPKVPPSPRKFDTWSGSSVSATRTRRATKAAIALRRLIIDDSEHQMDQRPSTLSDVVKVGGTKKTTVPRLRGKDVERLQNQLLKPESAGLVIAQARTLNKLPTTGLGLEANSTGSGSIPHRAVCLDVNEFTADGLLVTAGKQEKCRKEQEEKLAHHRYSTLKTAPPPPSRLPIILSLLESIPVLPELEDGGNLTLPLGLMLPPSAMSLHRPLAGALPTPETLRRGFDALLNAETKVYTYEGPSHKGLSPPLDRLSIYTYWWGFELVMPPPTLDYLSKVKQISTSLLNLLGIIVFAVPGGTRELAPFVGVLSRFIETEWSTIKAQDQGKGVVCAATWFLPAAIVARTWDFEEMSEERKKVLPEVQPDKTSSIGLSIEYLRK